MKNEKIIIDTDPWVDDALAIMYLLKSKYNVYWITTVFWNSNINNTTKNALKILSILKSWVPVYKWEDRPLRVEPTFAKSHWNLWFWWYKIKLINKVENKGAVDYLIDLLEKEVNVTVICLWPMTNIAKLSKLRPELLKNIWRLIILWWVVGEVWNISQNAEFNVFNDPDAFSMVLSLDIEKYLIPINVCRQVVFTSKDFDNLENNTLSKSIKKITKQYIDYYSSNKEYWNFTWWVMYDLLVTIFYTNSQIFSFKDCSINVVTTWNNIWEIYETRTLKNNCKLITSVNAEKLRKIFFNTMNNE